MRREIYTKLLAWKHDNRRKPLILKGARQVGKTYIIEQFGAQEYEQTIYINFEENKRVGTLFETDLDPQRILEGIHLLTGKNPSHPNTLLIFDEIQQCPNAITSLKYFQEQSNDIHLIAAGSLLGVKLSKAVHFPVGKVNFLDLYPMSFLEFLDALHLSHMKEHLLSKTDFEPLPEVVHETLMDVLKKYLIIGGMPEAVQAYVDSKDMAQSILVQQEMLTAYTNDFSKYADPTDIMRIMEIWNKIPAQLARENKKFMFSAIKQSARARDYEVALQWLINAGLALKSTYVSSPKLPLDSYDDSGIFKIYLLDTGLLSCLSRLRPSQLLEGNTLFQEFKGALTENYVGQALMATFDKKLHYWVSESSAEIDFILDVESHIYPLEVKSGTTKHKKSLLSYDQKYKPKLMLRANPMNFYRDNHFCNIPLYAIGIIHLLVQHAHSS